VLNGVGPSAPDEAPSAEIAAALSGYAIQFRWRDEPTIVDGIGFLERSK